MTKYCGVFDYKPKNLDMCNFNQRQWNIYILLLILKTNENTDNFENTSPIIYAVATPIIYAVVTEMKNSEFSGKNVLFSSFNFSIQCYFFL